jgi:hypothetical protein
MIIAKEKRRNNIAEYVLYMWHIEDLLRAFKLDIEIVYEKVIEGYKADVKTANEIKEWYSSIIHMMHSEGISEAGHLALVRNTVNEINEFHLRLLNKKDEEVYKHLYLIAKPNIELFSTKSNIRSGNEIELCFTAMYSYILLKLSGKEVSTETIESIHIFSKMLAVLSTKFKDWEEGRLDLK